MDSACRCWPGALWRSPSGPPSPAPNVCSVASLLPSWLAKLGSEEKAPRSEKEAALRSRCRATSWARWRLTYTSRAATATTLARVMPIASAAGGRGGMSRQ